VFAVHHRLSADNKSINLHSKSIQHPSEVSNCRNGVIFGDSQLQQYLPEAQHQALVRHWTEHVDQRLHHCGHREECGPDVRRLEHEYEEAAALSGENVT